MNFSVLSRRLQLEVNLQLSRMDTAAQKQLKNGLTLNRSTDRTRADVQTLMKTVLAHRERSILQDVPAEDEDPPPAGWQLWVGAQSSPEPDRLK